jgi:hypothetical protein
VLTIDRLSLQLPAGFEDRAAGLVDLIGARLASLEWPRGASIGHMRIEHTLEAGGASNEALAGAIAATVARHARGRP